MESEFKVKATADLAMVVAVSATLIMIVGLVWLTNSFDQRIEDLIDVVCSTDPLPARCKIERVTRVPVAVPATYDLKYHYRLAAPGEDEEDLHGGIMYGP